MLSAVFRMSMTVFLFFYTLLAVASCTPQEQETASPVYDLPQQAVSGPVTLNVLSARGEAGRQLQEAADRFAQIHGDVRITIRTVSDESDYFSTLRAGLLSGEQIDLFHILGYKDLLELEPYLEDLSGYGWIGGAVEGTLDAVSRDGGIYGIPYSVEGIGLIANRGIFEAAEVPLGDIRDLESLDEALGELGGMIRAGELEDAFPDLQSATLLPAQDTAYLTGQLADILFDGEFASAQQAWTAAAAGMEAGEEAGKLIDLLARHSAAGRGWQWLTQVTPARQLEYFANGRVAMVLQNVQCYGTIRQFNEAAGEGLRLLPVPVDNEPEDCVYLRVPSYWAVGADASEEAKRLAAEFLEWLYLSEEGAAMFAGEFGALSAYREHAADTGVPLHRQLTAYVEEGRYRMQHYREFPQDWGSEIFAPGIRRYLSEPELTWEEVLEIYRKDWAARRRNSPGTP